MNLRFTLAAFLEDEGDPEFVTWPAVRFEDPVDEWVAPVVTRDVLEAVLSETTDVAGEPHGWDGDVALYHGPVGDDGVPEYTERLVPDASGLYRLGDLRMALIRVP